MNLVTYQPRNELDFFFDAERFFENAFSGWESSVQVPTPRVNVLENEDNFVIHAAVPGMKNEDIDLEVKDNTLTLSGRTKAEKSEEKENYRIREFSQQSSHRTFQIGQWVDPDGITAKVENGMLEIILPKKEIVKPKKVKIN